MYLARRPAYHERSLVLAHLLASARAPKTLCGLTVDEGWAVDYVVRLPIGVCSECRRLGSSERKRFG